MFAIFKENPTFFRFILGRFCALVSDNILLFVIPLLVFRNTGSAALSGIVFFIEWIPQVISLPIAGSLADRFGGRRLFIISDLVRCISSLTAATLLIVSPSLSFPILCVFAFVGAFFQSQSLVSVESLVPKLFDDSQLVQTQSMLQTIQQLSMILGPLFCGLLVLVISKESIVYVAAAMYFLSFINVGTLKLRYRDGQDSVSSKASNSFIYQFKQSTAFIFGHPKLLILVIFSLSINLVVGLLLGGSPIISISEFDVSDPVYSLLQLSLGITSIVALTFTSKAFRLFSGELIFSLATLLIMVGGFICATANSFPFYVIGFSIVMASLAFFNVYMRSERVKLIPPADRGKVISIMIMFNLLPLPLCGVLISMTSRFMTIQTLLLVVLTTTTLIVVSLMALRWFNQKSSLDTEKLGQEASFK